MTMKKRLMAVCILLIAGLCACAPQTDETELVNMVDITGAGVSISLPKDWESLEKGYDDEFWVMSVSNADTGYADVFFTSFNDYDYSAELAIEDIESYYGENVIGSTEKCNIHDMTAYRFEYSMVDTGDDGDEYNFHGYEYTIDTPNGVIEIDIYDSQPKLTAKLFDSSDSQLELLRRIAESVEIG